MTADDGRRHVVVCGLDSLGFRTAHELTRLGERVVVVAERPREDFADALRERGLELVVGSCRDEDTLRRARLDDARAVAFLEEDEIRNLHGALAAQELNGDLRIVLRIFDRELGAHVTKLFRDAIALSASALAAPAFINAALGTDSEHRVLLDGVMLSVRSSDLDASDVLVPLSEVLSGRPTDGERQLCLTLAPPIVAPRITRVRRAIDRLRSVDPRLVGLLLAIAILIAVSSMIFHFFAGLGLVDAIYFTITVITTTGFGDINLRDAPNALKLYGGVLMLLGAASLAVLFGLIADVVLGARLARQLASVPARTRDHIIVCGLGTVGFRVVESLVTLGIKVAAAEVRASDFILAARRLGVPVVQADARNRATLESLRVRQARCLIAITDDDVANLAAALGARSVNPSLRVVLRLFDQDFARKVEHSFGITLSQSVSALAAPAFAAAVFGHQVVAAVPVGDELLVLVRVRIGASGRANGMRVADVERELRAKLLELDGGTPKRSGDGARLSAGDSRLLVATRDVLPTALGWFG